MMMPPMIPTTVKTPVSRGCLEEGRGSYGRRAGRRGRDGGGNDCRIAIRTGGDNGKLLLDIRVELVDGVEDVEEFVVNVPELDLR